MTIEERLKEMIIAKFGNMLAFSQAIGIPNSTLATIMKNGVHKANVGNIIKICQALGISTDDLAHDKIVPRKNQEGLTDLVMSLTCAKQNTDQYKTVTIDGKPLSGNEINFLIDLVDFGVWQIRKQRGGIDT